jgi:hypothetical protein
MSKNKNIPSNNPLYKRRKTVMNELESILLGEGYGSLFPPSQSSLPPAERKKYEAKKYLIVKQALEFGFSVPQKMIGQLHLGDPDPNPPTNYVDDGKSPFGT